jgi:hypothetical protein
MGVGGGRGVGSGGRGGGRRRLGGAGEGRRLVGGVVGRGRVGCGGGRARGGGGCVGMGEGGAFAGEAFLAFFLGLFEGGHFSRVHFAPDFVAVDGDLAWRLDGEADAGARPFHDFHLDVAIDDDALSFAAGQCQHNGILRKSDRPGSGGAGCGWGYDRGECTTKGRGASGGLGPDSPCIGGRREGTAA